MLWFLETMLCRLPLTIVIKLIKSLTSSSPVQELRDRIASDRSKHLIAKTSSLGWKFVSSLELLEGKVGHISMMQLRSQEMAFLAHKLAVSSLAKSGSELQLMPVDEAVVEVVVEVARVARGDTRTPTRTRGRRA
jgi:hypothetical protein